MPLDNHSLLPHLDKIALTPIATPYPVQLYLKREDRIHPQISGNKYWKLYPIITKLQQQRAPSPIFTFGGAFSNHIAAVAAMGKITGVETHGIIRGELTVEELANNPTLLTAKANGMHLHFVSRDAYRDKDVLTASIRNEYPDAVVLPEGGSTAEAVTGIQHMLSTETTPFDFLCCPVGTGGTFAGVVKYKQSRQKALGFQVVRDRSLPEKITQWSGSQDFTLVDASHGGYGKLLPEIIDFCNAFYARTQIPLDPIYTGKMMYSLFTLLSENYFPAGSRILAFHTGGLQGLAGANITLAKKNKSLLTFAELISE